MNTDKNPSITKLPALLESRNFKLKYNSLIRNARKGIYHDFKSPHAAPKQKLLEALSLFPELEDIREMVLNGDFDDQASDQDIIEIRKEMPKNTWKALGLLTEEEERKKKF